MGSELTTFRFIGFQVRPLSIVELSKIDQVPIITHTNDILISIGNLSLRNQERHIFNSDSTTVLEVDSGLDTDACIR
jgi:hypothetical protein